MNFAEFYREKPRKSRHPEHKTSGPLWSMLIKGWFLDLIYTVLNLHQDDGQEDMEPTGPFRITRPAG